MPCANRHFPSLEMLSVLLPPGCDRLTFGRDLYHRSLLLPPNLLLLLLSVTKEAGYSHSQLLQSIISEIFRPGFIPEDFSAPHKVQVRGWHGQDYWWQSGTVDGMCGRAGAFHALEKQLPPKLSAQFWPWQSLCWRQCQREEGGEGSICKGSGEMGTVPQGEAGWAVRHLTCVREPYRTVTAWKIRKVSEWVTLGRAEVVGFLVVSLLASGLNRYRELQGELAKVGSASWVGLSPGFGTPSTTSPAGWTSSVFTQICNGHNKWSCWVCFSLST